MPPDDTVNQLKRFQNALRLYSDDIPLETLKDLLKFQDTIQLQQWILDLEITGFQIDPKKQTLVVSSDLTDEINNLLNSFEDNSISKISSESSVSFSSKFNESKRPEPSYKSYSDQSDPSNTKLYSDNQTYKGGGSKLIYLLLIFGFIFVILALTGIGEQIFTSLFDF